jgi:F-box and WD-40 domain protein 1/11
MDNKSQTPGPATRVLQPSIPSLSRHSLETFSAQPTLKENLLQEKSSSSQSRTIPYTVESRQRLQSLPLGHEEDLIDRVRRSLHFGPAETNTLALQEREKRANGIRSLLRRASVSLKGKTRPRRNSHSVDNIVDENTPPRPSTSTWHKLRQATSFRHPHPNSISEFDSNYLASINSFDESISPTPGSGFSPPVIPRGFGGAAARATAAFQNENLERARQHYLLEESQGDGESGVGIAVSVHTLPQPVDSSISKIDFVSQLPVELAINILSHLDHYGLAQAALVSRNWSRISNNRHIWREAFFREKSSTYAMGASLTPGSGLGLPGVHGGRPWKEVYRIRHQLQNNWRDGKAKYVCLNGHLDSIYCVQFDEYV